MDSQPSASENVGNSNSQVGNNSAQSWASLVGKVGGSVVPLFPFSHGSNGKGPGSLKNSIMQPLYGDKQSSLETGELAPLHKKKRVSRKKMKTYNGGRRGKPSMERTLDNSPNHSPW